MGRYKLYSVWYRHCSLSMLPSTKKVRFCLWLLAGLPVKQEIMGSNESLPGVHISFSNAIPFRAFVSEMTYNVSSGMLNPTIPYNAIPFGALTPFIGNYKGI